MNFFCIGDEDTVRGFRLAGVAGRVVGEAAAAAAALAEAAAQPDCGIVILTQPAGAMLGEGLEAFRREHERPLIVEIPGPAGPVAGRRSLRAIAQEAIGIKVDEAPP